MDLTHPFSITARQVIVNRHHMNTSAGEGIEVARKGRHQGLAFTGFHLSNLAFEQHPATDQLHIEKAHAEHPLAGFTNNGKSLRQDLVKDRTLVLKRSSVMQTLAERSGASS